MAVNVELRGERFGEVVDRAGDDGLIERLAADAGDSSVCLRWIDPYGDTIFNRHQSVGLASELEEARAKIVGGEMDSLERLISLVRACADGVHLYVWCIGD